MDALAQRLDDRLGRWHPETSQEVRQRVTEIIDLADNDLLGLTRSRLRAVEQEVLDLFGEPSTR
jgi:hypothetical protein